MTYKSASRNLHFKGQQGSSAVRVTQRGYGGASLSGDPVEILPSVQQQYELRKLRAKEIDKILRPDLPFHEREALRAELANCLRQIGELRQLLQQGSRLAFEKIFVTVAQYRLPKDRFLTITEEAREIWRAEGYADFVPPPTQRERRKSSKKAMRTT